MTIKSQIVPHLPQQRAVQLWVRANYHTWPGTGLLRLVPSGTLKVVDSSGTVAHVSEFPKEQYPFVTWRAVGRGGKSGDRTWGQLVYRRFPVKDLEPNTHYTANLEFSDGTTDHCTFRTLPASLESPLLIGLGSCYWGRDDKDRKVNKRWGKMLKEVGEPHVTFLAGDQVYLDQPPLDEWFTRKSMDELETFMTGRYDLHWGRLSELLRHGTKMFLPDDHEFWNNYPGLPGTPWRALMASSQYRRDVASTASMLFDAYQGVASAYQMSVGDDLAIYVLDTRRHRNREGTRFLDNETLDGFERWIKALRQPGIIVLSQPLFQPSFGGRINFEGGVAGLAAGATGLLIGGEAGLGAGAAVGAAAGLLGQEILGDKGRTHERNIGAHEPQYLRFCRILTSSPCDLLVLSGEIHVSRFASVRLVRDDEKSILRICEVVSSPMQLLTTGGDKPSAVESDRVTFWPPTSAHCGNVKRPEQIDYEAAHNLNGFATLKFSKDPDDDVGRRRVRVELSYHTTVAQSLNIDEPTGHSFTLTGLAPDVPVATRGLAFVDGDSPAVVESLELNPMGVGAKQRFSLQLHNFSNAPVTLEGAVVLGDWGCSVDVPDGLIMPAGQSKTVEGVWEATPSTGQMFVREAPYRASARVVPIRAENQRSVSDKGILISVNVVLPPFPEAVTAGPTTIDMGHVAVGSQGGASIWVVNKSSDDVVLAKSAVIKTGGVQLINMVARAIGSGSSSFSIGVPAGKEIIHTNQVLGISIYFTPTSTTRETADIRLMLHKKGDPNQSLTAVVQVSGEGIGRPVGEPHPSGFRPPDPDLGFPP